ncbi:MAG TPA: tyrosine-type recombinase/integrase [Gammaproteobacteria bacterium]|nr:tyrosine-type recombinase/integrase [Gammaproteobacteria bacterium]
MINHDSWTLDSIVQAYKQDQRRVRGLREATLKSYEQVLRPFLRLSLGEDPFDPTRLTPADVVRFVTSLQERFAARSMKYVRTALRSLLRFLRMKGYCDEKLELSIPAVAHWRLSALPRCLDEQQLKRVLEAFDQTPCGLRDRAMVLCLSTLGLRPRELAELRLEDIDWRGGTLRLRTRKTRRGAVLPLPREAGHAIVIYLRNGRPTTTERRVFVQHSGRRCGTALSAPAITAAAVRAVQRAGVDAPRGCAYVFRHTVASRLVARGATLKEVADFLGHQCLDTTTIYAKLDLPALREVALPWPEVLP